jgi:predicted DNA-binding transcriptional regulator YafY
MATRLERLVLIDEEIRKGRYPSVEKLCVLFEVAARTIYEDIRELKDNLGLDIRFDRSRGGYYNANPAKTLPSFDLSDGEVFALTIGKEMLAQYTGTAFEPILRTAIEKICQRLPDRVKLDLNDIKSVVKFHTGAIVPISRKMFIDINEACEGRKQLELTYFAPSTGDTTLRHIDPYRLLESRGTWYIVGYCHMRKALRMFALHRIRDYQVMEKTFEADAQINVDDWIESAFQLQHGDDLQHVKIHFASPSSRYIRERVWHPSQQLTEDENDGCILEFDTLSLDEVKRWVLTYGAEALVIEPPDLVQMVQADVEAMHKAYATPVSGRSKP